MLSSLRNTFTSLIVLILLVTPERAPGQDNPGIVSQEVFASEHNALSAEGNCWKSEWGITCLDDPGCVRLKRAVQAKEWSRAKQIAEGLIRSCPKVGIGHYWAGIIEFDQGSFIKALHYFEAAVDRAPTIPMVHLDLGVAYLMLNQFRLFEDEMLWLTTHDPRNPLPFYYLGRYYSKAFDNPREKASLFLEQALARNPRDYKSRYHLGHMHELNGEIEMARKEYQVAWQDVSSQNANWSLPLQGLARVCLLENQTDQGLKYAEQALALDPDEPGNYLVLGKLHLKAKHYPESVAALKRASELERTNPSPHYLLARAYRESGQPAEAENEAALFGKIKLAYRNE